MKGYKEVSNKKLDKMTDSEKLREVKKAVKAIGKNYVPPKKKDLDENGIYKKIISFDEGAIRRLEHNLWVYTVFSDIVQRIVEFPDECLNIRKVD